MDAGRDYQIAEQATLDGHSPISVAIIGARATKAAVFDAPNGTSVAMMDETRP
jgi:hypothetical protein